MGQSRRPSITESIMEEAVLRRDVEAVSPRQRATPQPETVAETPSAAPQAMSAAFNSQVLALSKSRLERLSLTMAGELNALRAEIAEVREEVRASRGRHLHI